MKTNVYFVRHAHSVYTPDELARPLSERGMGDASVVTELLRNEPIEVVLSSPYQRAIQTVKGVADYFHLNVELYEDLKERTLADGPLDDFPAAIVKVWHEPDFSWEGGESNITAQRRGVKVLHEILQKYEGKHIVIGSHGNIMSLIMNHFDPKYDFDFWSMLDMPDIYKLTFEKGELMDVKRVWEREVYVE